MVSETAHVRVSESAVDIDAELVDLTLKLFWNLASLQIRDPSAAPRLLETNPRDPSKVLGSLNVGFDSYRQPLAKVANVKPVVLFMSHGADPEEEAQRHGLTISPWPPLTPPAFFTGPKLDTLILFEPASSARRELPQGGPIPLARIASAAGLTGLWLAEGPSPEQLGARLYRVQPREWKKAAVFEHTRCLFQGPVTLLTKLSYQGGFTESKQTLMTEKDWGQCTLSPDPKLRAATVKQPGARKPGRPVIVAGSYFLTPRPSPFLADWISVK